MARDKKSREDRDEQEQGTKDIETSLEEIDDWEDTEETSFAEVDDGKYQAKILSGTINKSKSSERLQVSWELEIMNTKFAGRHVFKHDGIDTPEARGWFRGGLARLGVDWPKSASELPDILEELKDTFCEIRLVTKKGQDRPNVYFNSALDEKDIEEPEVEEKEEKHSSKSREKNEDEDEKKEERKGKRDKDEDEDEDEKPKKKKKDEDEDEDEKEPEEKVKTNFNDDDMRTRHKERIKEIAEDFRYKTTDYKCLTDCLADIAEVELGVEGDFDNAQDLLNEVEDAIDEKEKKEKVEEEKEKGSSRRK